MLGRIVAVLGICWACFAPGAQAFDINQVDEADLRAIKGMGPVKSRALLEERRANGPFVDERDLAARVKGIGPKMVARLRDEGMSFGAAPRGGGRPGAPTAVSATQCAPPPPAVRPCPLTRGTPRPSGLESKSARSLPRHDL